LLAISITTNEHPNITFGGCNIDVYSSVITEQQA
jgi:hypothetical protein